MPRKSYACTDTEPKNKRKKEGGITLTESGGVGQIGQENVYCCFAHHCGITDSMICFDKKNEDRIGGKFPCLSFHDSLLQRTVKALCV